MARDFNGSTDRIDWNNIWASGGVAQTISCWVYPDVITAAQYLHMVHESAATGVGGLLFWIDNGEATGGAIKATGRFATTDAARASNDSSIAAGSWQHLLVTWDGSTIATNIHIYVDGVEVGYFATNNGSGAARAGGGEQSVGGRIFDNNRNFNGRIAEVAHWDRVLAAGEIAMQAGGYSPAFIPRGLRSYPDLIRNQRDRVSGQAGTLDGTTVLVHDIPGLKYPVAPSLVTAPVAAAVGNPWHVYANQ